MLIFLGFLAGLIIGCNLGYRHQVLEFKKNQYRPVDHYSGDIIDNKKLRYCLQLADNLLENYSENDLKNFVFDRATEEYYENFTETELAEMLELPSLQLVKN